MQLIERMRTDTNGQEEGRQRRSRAPGLYPGGGRRAERDVAQMPCGVGRMQQRDEVAPRAFAASIERRALKPRR